MANQYPSVYLPLDTAERLERYCAENDVESRNSVITDALDAYLEAEVIEA